MRGKSDIPELRLTTLNKFIQRFNTPPELMFSNMFPSVDYPSSTIEWESQSGTRGMAPFKAPGDPTGSTSILGYAKHSAEAAFWGEKMFFGEEFLNNLREPGTLNVKMNAKRKLATESERLVYRAKRRKEWMFSKMLFDGSYTYSVEKGYKASVNYQIPDTNKVTLLAGAKWGTGNNKDIIGNIIDGKTVISDGCGGKVKQAIFNSTVLKYIARDPSLLTLLQKSTFGEGDLFKGSLHKLVGVNVAVLGALLDIPSIIVYDELFEVRAYLTSAVVAAQGASYVIYVDDTSDFEVGGTIRFNDVSAGTYEEETISAISTEAGTITVTTGPSVAFKAAEDYVSMKRKYVPDDKFLMMTDSVEGQPICEYMAAPYGVDAVYGLNADTHDNWDPDGIWLRVQDKGLPVIYQRDAIYVLDVE